MKTEVYDIKGMTCASCSAAVERVTRKLEGVESSQVNLATNKMTITYDEEKLGPEQIIAKVQRAGFDAEQAHEKQKEEQQEEVLEAEEAQHKIKRRLIVSIILAVSSRMAAIISSNISKPSRRYSTTGSCWA